MSGPAGRGEILPEERQAWELEIDLRWSLDRDDEAIALCAEAADRFPEMRARHDNLCRERTRRAMDASERPSRPARSIASPS